MQSIADLLRIAHSQQASDLHLTAGLKPRARIHGEIEELSIDSPPLSSDQIMDMLDEIMSPAQQKHFRAKREIDFSFAIPGLARFRVNGFTQHRGAAAVLRTIPSKVYSLQELDCPPIFAKLAMRPRGLVLVTGPTGSGKSTTLAAMIDHINSHEKAHILTLEDPIEFVHEPKRSIVNQREVGSHTDSFSDALRNALREDPDAILVGELRDLETIRLALTAAETGHLVFGTLHTSSAAKTIDRIVDVFPAAEKEMVRIMLSESLVAVISQTLCKKAEGSGRVAAHEIMIGTTAIRNLIRESKVSQMNSAIQTGQGQGMQTLDMCLQQLVNDQEITLEEARSKATVPDAITSHG